MLAAFDAYPIAQEAFKQLLLLVTEGTMATRHGLQRADGLQLPARQKSDAQK
jgi:hypothetical protein